MRFEQLYSLVTEANDFSDLPDNLSGWGYGLWIYPSGEYELLYMGEHRSVAHQIVDKLYDDEYRKIFKRRMEGETNNDFYKRYEAAKEQGNIIECEDFLPLKGFVRVSIDDETVYAGGIRGRVSSKAIKTAKDIAKFYNRKFDFVYIDPPKYADKVEQ